MPGLMQSWFQIKKQPKAPSMAAPAPAATAGPSAAAPSGVAPGTAPEDYRNQQNAFWQQFLAGTGNTQAGGALPEGIQSNIDRQASLL